MCVIDTVILDNQMDTDTGNIESLVWWMGVPKDEATWEPIQNINRRLSSAHIIDE